MMTNRFTRTGVRRRRFDGYVLLMVAIAIAMFFMTLFK